MDMTIGAHIGTCMEVQDELDYLKQKNDEKHNFNP